MQEMNVTMMQFYSISWLSLMLTHFSGKVSPCGLKMTAVASINFQLLRMKKAIPSVSCRSPENIADGLGEVI